LRDKLDDFGGIAEFIDLPIFQSSRKQFTALMTDTPQHIVFLTPGFADGEDDDVCTPYHQIMFRAMHARAGVTVSVIAFQYPYIKRVFTWHGMKVYACGGNNKRLTKHLKTWRQAKTYFEQIHSENPVTQLNAMWAGECGHVGRQLASKFKLPLVISVMGQDAKKIPRYLRNGANPNIKITANSQFHAGVVEAQLKRPVNAIIPHGIDPKDRLEQELPRDIDVLGVGALIALKNYDEFLNIIKKLIEQRGVIKACIVGSGPENAALLKRAGELKVRDSIEFTGQLSRRETLKYMRRSKVLLHPSSYESFGFVFVEALQQGVPVVSKAVGFATEASHWKVCKKTDEMIAAVSDFLEHPLADDPVILQTAEQTVDQYLALYGS
jgi:1,2-diacylglycerol 3-alpha-glucosyltransferase